MLKKKLMPVCFGAICSTLLLFMGCDFSGGGGSDFNTSQGAGINVNWSGVYFGQFGGGRAVANTSGAGAIIRLVLSQGGNKVEVVDSQGSRYTGSVGSPGAVSTAVDGVFPSGASLVEAQITWTGKDEVAAKDVEFVGVLHVVAVSDIQGNTVESSSTATDTTSAGTTLTNVTQTIVESGEGFTNTIEVSVSNPNADTSTSADTVTTASTTTFQITEANSQFRLQGTWVEVGGVSSGVDALSPGGIASITTTTETTTN